MSDVIDTPQTENDPEEQTDQEIITARPGLGLGLGGLEELILSHQEGEE